MEEHNNAIELAQEAAADEEAVVGTEDSDASDREEVPDDSEADSGKPETPRGVDKRIEVLTAKRRAAEEEAQRLRQERDSLESRLAQLHGNQPSSQQANAQGNQLREPNVEDYENWRDYARDLKQYQVTVMQMRQQQATYLDKQAKERERIESYQQQIDRIGNKYPDIEDAIAVVGGKLSQEAANALISSEKGAELTYYLYEHPEALEGLTRNDNSSHDPYSVAIKIGRLESKISLPPKRKSSAPEPVSSVAGKGASVDSKPKTAKEWSEKLKSRRR